MDNILSLIEKPGIVLVDVYQNILYCNERLASFISYKAEELIGKPLNNIVPVRYQETHKTFFSLFTNNVVATQRAAISNRFGKSKQLPMVDKNGHEVIVDISLQSLITKDHQILILAFVENTDEQTELMLQHVKSNVAALMAQPLPLS